MTNFEKKNTVDSKNQVTQSVYFDGNPSGNPRVMFIGNSITLHAPKDDIGWYGNWGMAASSMDRDYVHIIMSGIKEKHPDAAFCIVQASSWETAYTNCDYDALFSSAKDFNPDIILCTISANIPADKFEAEAFCENLHKLHTYLSSNDKNVKIFESTSFSGNPKKNAGIKLYCDRYGATMVNISDISHDEKNLALGLFEHDGVAHHPGDNGMAEIAKRYLNVIF